MRYFKAMYRRNPPWFWQMMLESVVFLGVMAALLVLDWQKFILYVLIPHQYAAWGIVTMNFLQHDGCDENSEHNHSRNFVGKLVNWFTYNNGFHSIHHKHAGPPLEPDARGAREGDRALHPPGARSEEPARLPVDGRSCGPAKRETYDGKPYIPPPAGEDEEWIPGPKETPDDVSLGAIPG
jgi:hypothetical protein